MYCKDEIFVNVYLTSDYKLNKKTNSSNTRVSSDWIKLIYNDIIHKHSPQIHNGGKKVSQTIIDLE